MLETVMEQKSGLMTIGDLAQRTGLSVKAIREFEGRGLIYSAGRSPSNYRLFDDAALWCIGMIKTLRGLGLTIKEIEELTAVYMRRPDQEAGPRLAQLLDRVEHRIDERVKALEEVRGRVRSFRQEHRRELAGGRRVGLGDPRRAKKSA